MLVHRNEEAFADGANPYKLGTQKCCGFLKTRALLDGLTKYGFDAAFGGARRDEEKSRAKERIYSFRDAYGQWDPKNQRPELWNIFNARIDKGETIRVFPLSNWTELDVWQYIHLENIPIVPLYFAKERPMVVRGESLLPIENDPPLLLGEKPQMVMSRMRSLGCTPCTGAIRSSADTLPKIIEEFFLMRRSERENRIIDHDQEGSMEFEEARGLLLMARSAPSAIEEFLEQEQQKELLRFTTAGSVDDGKSTLIGRLLYDSKGVYEDQLASVKKASVNRSAGPIDFSLLTDGLKAEREQGITIDVAYRYFTTPKRKFIIADTPGHEQYTRNMATGRVHGAACHRACRCAQRRSAAIAPARIHRVVACHSPRCCRGEQDGPRGLQRGSLQPHLRGLSRLCTRSASSERVLPSDQCARRGQRCHTVARARRGITAARCCISWKPLRSR